MNKRIDELETSNDDATLQHIPEPLFKYGNQIIGFQMIPVINNNGQVALDKDEGIVKRYKIGSIDPDTGGFIGFLDKNGDVHEGTKTLTYSEIQKQILSIASGNAAIENLFTKK